MKHSAHVGGLYVGDSVRFYTAGENRSVTGTVTGLHFGATTEDYAEVYLDVDGMTYTFGTGGHLGHTWTTESGSEQWWSELVGKRTR